MSDTLEYEPRRYSKSFKQWQQFIGYSSSGEDIVYRTKEGDICSPAHVEKLIAQAISAERKAILASLPEQLPDTSDYSCGKNETITQVTKAIMDRGRRNDGMSRL